MNVCTSEKRGASQLAADRELFFHVKRRLSPSFFLGSQLVLRLGIFQDSRVRFRVVVVANLVEPLFMELIDEFWIRDMTQHMVQTVLVVPARLLARTMYVRPIMVPAVVSAIEGLDTYLAAIVFLTRVRLLMTVEMFQTLERFSTRLAVRHWHSAQELWDASGASLLAEA